MPTPTQTDPVAQLSAIINRLCNLSNDPGVAAGQQQQLLAQANMLNGDLVKLVTQQLDAADADYNQFMTGVANVTKALNAAEAAIQAAVADVNAVAAVTASITGLIQQGVQLVTIAAKYAAA